ncbi:family 10 glycosylhydrolase [Pedobacter arcticus]|uniref:family 10 glycosylhydrolase n=1 Tax=Pedobacter arcticus TaxID=752140 RepID=UPI000365C576|nr:family 10 glycosylhydrolase [Pedobacter arcticus]
MKSSVILCALIFTLNFNLKAQDSPKRELRGAWIATFSNIDWPIKTQTPQQQKNAFIDILNHHQATGINAVFVQIRSQCDAFYPSELEPWSADLTGKQGVAPSPYWDPLTFMIAECHKRNMEFHAWLNPYRAISSVANLSSFSANHVAKQHPDWLITSGNLRTLDPGLPAVRTYILEVIKDIVNRYDVDGVHFDDYFYPNSAFSDDQTFANFSRGFTNRDDWRRDNVNILIKNTYSAINLLKPWVKFGVSPSGIYRNSTNPDIGTPTSGLEHYNSLYADSKKWIAEGWVDYLAPQIYWYRGQANADYSKITPWWNNNAYGRHIYIGQAGYKVNDATQGSQWLVAAEIPNQVRLNRQSQYSNLKGQVIYNTKSLLANNNKAFRDSLKLNVYNKLSLIPIMPWKDNVAPASPTALIGNKYGQDSLVLTWTAPPAAISEFDKVKAYVVYKSANAKIDTLSNVEIIAVVNQPKYVDMQLANGYNFQYKVTALDRFHNESLSSNTISTLTTAIDDLESRSIAKIIVYPNPSTQHITVELKDYAANKVWIQIIDMQGKVRLRETFKRNVENTYVVDFQNRLNPGQYIVAVKGENFQEHTKIIVR